MSDGFRLPPNQQLVAAGKWPFVGERLPRRSDEPWTLSIAGSVERPVTFTLAEVHALPQVTREIDIHCVTRWTKPGARFTGVTLATLLEIAGPTPAARYVSFVARSERNHSTSLPLAEALALDALVALEFEHRPLEVVHGGPVRMVVPERYFYKSLKWLERIEVLETDRLGFWEATAGYHNRADPWREERYMTPTLDRREVARLLASRDFSGRDLRSLDARGHELTGLLARGALLRDADFRDCRLQRACFDGANLSNAHLQGADLRGATFLNADVEGADFTGADLRGADFRGASLFGASFVDEQAADQSVRSAVLDGATQIDPAALEQLTPGQADHVRRLLGAAS